jgi:hypothetical protein
MAEQAIVPGPSGWAAAVCAVGVSVLATIEAAAVTLRTTSRAQEMLAATDDWSARLEETQYTLGEGPSVEAFGTGGPVLVTDLTSEQTRWPVFAEAALSAGASAMFAFPLQVGAIRLGTLDLYRRRPGGLPPAELTDAVVLADLATTALLEEAVAAERAGEDWVRPVSSYQDMSVATGMIAATLHISLDDAFARLRGRAFAEDRSVLDVARDVVRRRITLGRFPVD